MSETLVYWRRYTCHTDTPRLEFRRSASEWVCRHFIPRSWSRGVLLVLAGYIDGSNLHGGNVDVVSVGGCAANAELWKIWENKWDDLLQFGGISKWDHAKFMAGWKPGKPAQRWSESERPIARRLLCESFEAIRPAYVGATVRLTDYNELRTQYNSLPEDPYYFLLDRCMQRLIQGMFEYPHNEGMAVYCDQDKKESLVLQLAKWHEEFLRATEDLAHQKDRDRRIVTAYGSNLDYVPLQAADVIAHEIMRFARQHPAMKFVATNVSTGSVILDRLKMYGPSLVMCLSKRMLEAELDGSAWVPGHPHGYRFIPSAS